MMKTSTNKTARSIYERFFDSETYNVVDAYKTRCSDYKISAENDIKAEMFKNNGYAYKIISANGFMFTCGYLYRNENNDLILVYHSKTRRDEILVDTDINGFPVNWRA